MNTQRVVPLDWRVPKLVCPCVWPSLGRHNSAKFSFVSIVICCGMLGREEDLEMEDYKMYYCIYSIDIITNRSLISTGIFWAQPNENTKNNSLVPSFREPEKC